MSRSPSGPPTIAELTATFLRRTQDAETLTAAADALGEVQPHEVTIGYRAEPRLAWQESLQAGYLGQLLSGPAANSQVSSGLLRWGTRHLESGELPHVLIVAAAFRAS